MLFLSSCAVGYQALQAECAGRRRFSGAALASARMVALPEQDTLFAPDAFLLAFASPILRVSLEDALPSGTLRALEESVAGSWSEHLGEQKQMPLRCAHIDHRSQ